MAPPVLSFAVTLASPEAALRFAKRVATVLNSPLLRIDNIVHVVIVEDQLKVIRSLASDLDGIVGYES